MNEDSILKKIRAWCESTHTAATLVGVGDDAALLRGASRDFLLCSDLMIENTHFDLAFSTPADVGHKSVARCLSDIAAMGGQPLGLTISIAIPRTWSSAQIAAFLEGFYRGAIDVAKATNTSIVGGDLSKIAGPLVIDVAATGESENLWRRSLATPGDLAYLTGPLGGAAFALLEMQAARKAELSNADAFKHLRPQPRFDVVARLGRSPIVCAMDVSDGLAQDSARLCEESRVMLNLQGHLIPAPHGLENALYGGDDYELLLAVPSAWADTADGAAKLTEAGCIQVGRFEARNPYDDVCVQLEDVSGNRRPLLSQGHDPFRDT